MTLHRILEYAHHASAVVRAVQVPAVRVLLAGAAALRALIDVPAAHPGGVSRESSLALAVEAAGGVDTVRLLPAVCCAVKVDVVNVALVQLIARGLIHVSLAVVTISAVLIVQTAHIAITTPVIVLVTNPVTAVVTGAEPKRGRVVGKLSCGEVLGVEALVIPAHRPPGVLTVAVIDAVALPLLARVIIGAPPLTAVIIRIPAAPIVTPGGHAVVLTTDHGALSTWVNILPGNPYLYSIRVL